nr:hypothetical protein [Lachnospiraceae bacterium]
MDLEILYRAVDRAVSSLDFPRIWPGFAPLKFALYDAEKCFFNGRYVDKTDDFCANTSINYRGEQIAIWMVQEDLPLPVLTSKLVHEMFHGFQTLQGWTCWPDEMEALRRYRYDAENLCLKLRENELLLALLDGFDDTAFRELTALRKRRSGAFPFEFSYECKVEEIEGTANYVEWQVLQQLDENAAAALTDRMRPAMTRPERLFPIRISCYFTGALMIHAMRRAGVYDFAPAERPAPLPLVRSAAASDGLFPGKDACYRQVSDAVASYQEETAAIVRSALDRNDVVLEGPLELVTVNIYNARYHDGYVTSTYFLMYRDGAEEKMIPGNFVIKMRDGKTIDNVYRWE